jgi:enoyl-[acyl-carrier protein] reductase I
MGIIDNKNVLIMGVRNKWSIAWGIAKSAYEQGARIIFTYQSDREKESVENLVKDFENSIIKKCDVTDDKEVENLFNELKSEVKNIDGIVHCIAHANKEDLKKNFLYTSREGYAHAMEVSAYSLLLISKYAKDLMPDGGSIITLSYHGAEKVMPGYNVMGAAKAALESTARYLASDLGPIGIRVNIVSPGPIKTISTRGINDFDNMMDIVEKRSPLRKSVTPEDIGNAATFLLSDLSKSITGEVLHVDNGYNIMGI